MNAGLTLILWTSYLLALYFTIYWIVVFLEKKEVLTKENSAVFSPKNYPTVSIIIPAYNEEQSIEKTIQSVLDLEYPQKKLQIVVVNDGSTDRTQLAIEKIVANNKQRNIQIIVQENQGKGAALNNSLRQVRGTFFACLDADSYVDSQTLKRMLAYFEQGSNNLALVTPQLKVDKPTNILQKFQRVEYITAMLIVRLMGYMDCIYIAPGPFTLYRTAIVRKLGGFDEHNLTEDQEIAYRIQKHQYELKQCPKAYVYTLAPPTLRELYRQRNRWFKGTILNLCKYRKLLLNKEYGDFGMFQMPLNLSAFLLAWIAVFFFGYYTIKPLVRGIYDLSLVGFDIWPYFHNLKFTFNILDLQFGILFIIYTLLFIAILLFYFGHSTDKESITQYGLVYLLPYFFVYYLFLSIVSVIVITEILIGRKQQW